MTRRACDTCRFLAVPEDKDHAKHYRICKVITPLPANMHVWDRAAVEGRVEGSARWISKKVVEEALSLKECTLHQAGVLP